MPFLTKSSILFVFINLIRLLSVVAICLAFSGEIVTMVSDLRNARSTSDTTSASIPSTTATTHIFRRSFDHVEMYNPVYSSSLPTSIPSSRLSKREPVSIRDESSSTTASPTTTHRSSHSKTTSTSSPVVTATNIALASSSPSSPSTCSYISSTSIPTQPGGSLFSTLSRIFCCLILFASLISEVGPPATTRIGRGLERWWKYCFPPFGNEFGTGMLGGVQVFVGCTVLSHAVGKFTQVSGWFLFIVGIINLLCGLAFGSRLKIIRSPYADSTSPSALRKLRLGGGEVDSRDVEVEKEGGGGGERRKWCRFDNASNEERDIGHSEESHRARGASESIPPIASRMMGMNEDARRVRFGSTTTTTSTSTPADQSISKGTMTNGTPKRSASRNGPNGIVISAPMQLRGGGAMELYGEGEMEEVGKGAAGVPPPPGYR